MCLSLLPLNVFAEGLEVAGGEPVPTCGLEEHTHGDGCYIDPTGVPYCEREKLAAQHNCDEDDVYDEVTGERICPLDAPHDCAVDDRLVYCGKVEHTHDETCPEGCPVEVHEHTDACFDFEANRVLVCPLTEHPEHTDECYAKPANDVVDAPDPESQGGIEGEGGSKDGGSGEGGEIVEETPADIQLCRTGRHIFNRDTLFRGRDH